MRKKCIIAAACLLTAVFLYSVYQIWTQSRAYLQGDAAYRSLDEFIAIPTQSNASRTPDESMPSAASKDSENTNPSARSLPPTDNTEASPPVHTQADTGTPSPAQETASDEYSQPMDSKEVGQSNLPAQNASGTPSPIENPEFTIPPEFIHYTLPEKEYDYPDIVWPEVDFERLKQINPEIVGWLYLESGSINYPLTQAEDNSKYLDFLFDGTRNAAGCLFLDADNSGDFLDLHSVVYGHNLKNGAMFGSLVYFKNQTYYNQYPHFLLITEDARYVVEIFSGYVAGTESGAWDLIFLCEDDFEQWKQTVAENSSIDTEIVPEPGERVLTLSTCSYEFENARYVLHGVLHKAKMPDEPME